MRISDWSSDVCSSDLNPAASSLQAQAHGDIHTVAPRARSGCAKAQWRFPSLLPDNRGIAAPFLSAISSNVRHWRPADGPRWRQSRLKECRLRLPVAAEDRKIFGLGRRVRERLDSGGRGII